IDGRSPTAEPNRCVSLPRQCRHIKDDLYSPILPTTRARRSLPREGMIVDMPRSELPINLESIAIGQTATAARCRCLGLSQSEPVDVLSAGISQTNPTCTGLLTSSTPPPSSF